MKFSWFRKYSSFNFYNDKWWWVKIDYITINAEMGKFFYFDIREGVGRANRVLCQQNYAYWNSGLIYSVQITLLLINMTSSFYSIPRKQLFSYPKRCRICQKLLVLPHFVPIPLPRIISWTHAIVSALIKLDSQTQEHLVTMQCLKMKGEIWWCSNRLPKTKMDPNQTLTMEY